MFWHFHIIIRQFPTNALLIYTRFFKLQLLEIRLVKLFVLVHARPVQQQLNKGIVYAATNILIAWEIVTPKVFYSILF
jgi:hypothetical protein